MYLNKRTVLKLASVTIPPVGGNSKFILKGMIRELIVIQWVDFIL